VATAAQASTELKVNNPAISIKTAVVTTLPFSDKTSPPSATLPTCSAKASSSSAGWLFRLFFLISNSIREHSHMTSDVFGVFLTYMNAQKGLCA
jgi:hypothetical protein